MSLSYGEPSYKGVARRHSTLDLFLTVGEGNPITLQIESYPLKK